MRNSFTELHLILDPELILVRGVAREVIDPPISLDGLI